MPFICDYFMQQMGMIWNTEDNLDMDNSEIEDNDEIEIIYQKCLENHKKRRK